MARAIARKRVKVPKPFATRAEALSKAPAPAPQPTAPQRPPEPSLPASQGREKPTARLKVPIYLLEGDEPTPLPPEVRQTFYRAAEPPRTPLTPAPEPVREHGPRSATFSAPESKPTAPISSRVELVLTARDPHCLYAFWEIEAEHLARCITASADGRLVLRIHRDHLGTQPLTEIHLTVDSRHCFAHVAHAGSRYISELGFYHGSRRWHVLASSGEAVTPPEAPAATGTPVRFVVPEPPALPVWEPSAPPTGPGVETWRGPWQTVEPPRATDRPPWLHSVAGVQHEDQFAQSIHFGAPGTEAPAAWVGETHQPIPPEATPAIAPKRPPELTEIIERWVERQIRADSITASELARERVERPLSGPPELPGQPSSFNWEVAPPPSPAAAAEVAIPSSEAPLPPPPVDFWFKVNAELIVYGSTEPSAQVTIGGNPIRLRPDGSFSFRFALPDGVFHLPVVATALHGDQRQAVLEFSRDTYLTGEVGEHPRDPALKPPLPEHTG